MFKSFLPLLVILSLPIFSQAKTPAFSEDAVNPKELEQIIRKELDKQKDSIPVQFGAFIDAYHSHNLNRPKVTERNYTTQAVRNDEININLAHIEAKLETDRYRGRVALQFGTSVNANYLPESTNQRTSNQLSVRNIQEAYAGMKIAKNTWLDGGIYFGHIGFESWISGNNWLYTRALVLDYVPYYSSGFRLSHTLSNKLSIQFHLMNGWSIITDNNRNKSFGFQAAYKPVHHLSLTYNLFIGNEAPTSSATNATTGEVTLEYKGNERQTRYYHNFIAHYDFTPKFSMAASFDVGFQRNPYSLEYNPVLTSLNPAYFQSTGSPAYVRTESTNSFKQWYNGTIWLTYRFLEEWRISSRLERYVDIFRGDASDSTVKTTNVPIAKSSDIYNNQPYTDRRAGGYKLQNGFQVGAISIGLDRNLSEIALLRFEAKYLRSMDPIFDYRDSKDLSRIERLFITAISVKF